MTGADLLEGARRLAPQLLERGAQADSERRISDATIGEMRAAGFFRALQPKRWGGYELDLQSFYDVLMTLAEADMSTAWVYGVLGVAPWVMALLDDRAASDVWANDDSALVGLSLAPAGTATPVEGGVRIGGRWRYASGSAHCDWAFVGTLVNTEAGAPGPGRSNWHVLLVPKSDYRIDDVWYTLGLKGTGSNDIVIDDAFVPAHRMRRMAENATCTGVGQALNSAALYRLPFGQVFGGGVAFGPIGALRGMLREFRTFAETRVRSGGRTAIADPDTQLTVADAENTIDELSLIVARNVRELSGYAERGEVPPMELRIKYKFQMAMMCERARDVATRIVQAAGASGIATQHRFGRTLADLTSARQHITNQYEMHGRHWGAYLLGGEPVSDPMQ